MPIINNLDRFNSSSHYANYCFVILTSNYEINDDIRDTEYRTFLEFIYNISSSVDVINKCKELDLFIPACYLTYHFRINMRYTGYHPLALVDKVKFYCEILQDCNFSNIAQQLTALKLPERHDKQNFHEIYDLVTDIERQISKEAICILRDKAGVYKLYDKKKKLIYIGRSKNLLDRVPSSAKERGASYFSVIICNSIADSFILEPYLITKLNPPLNSEFKTKHKPTFTLKVPKQTKLFSFKKIKYVKYN